MPMSSNRLWCGTFNSGTSDNFILLDEQLPSMKLSQVHFRYRWTCMFLYLRWLITWRVIGWCFVQFYAKFFWRIPLFFRVWPRFTPWFITWVTMKFWSRSISVCFCYISLVSVFPVISGSLSQTTLEIWKTCKNDVQMGSDKSVTHGPNAQKQQFYFSYVFNIIVKFHHGIPSVSAFNMKYCKSTLPGFLSGTLGSPLLAELLRYF
jgi:hypothetical protein